MNEQDYKELIDYLLESLEKIGAKQIVEQIKEISTYEKILENKKDDMKSNDKKIEKRSVREIQDSQLCFLESSDFNPTKAYINTTIEPEVRIQNISNKEIYEESIQILSNYLEVVPEMAAKISEYLEVDDSNIVWKDERRNEFKDSSNEILAPMILKNFEDKTKITDCLRVLYSMLDEKEDK